MFASGSHHAKGSKIKIGHDLNLNYKSLLTNMGSREDLLYAFGLHSLMIGVASNAAVGMSMLDLKEAGHWIQN